MPQSFNYKSNYKKKTHRNKYQADKIHVRVKYETKEKWSKWDSRIVKTNINQSFTEII